MIRTRTTLISNGTGLTGTHHTTLAEINDIENRGFGIRQIVPLGSGWFLVVTEIGETQP